MSFRDESASSSDDGGGVKDRLLSGINKLNENSSAIDNDSIDDPAEMFDHSSDDSNENDDFDVNGQKRYKKRVNPSKSKVKIKTLTIDGQLVYFCKICDKIFTRRKDKLNHELAHSGESVLTCTECGKEYMHESSLASHMRTHAGDPLFMCDLCPKMFAQSHHLKTHILSHSEPTNFVCKTCYIEFPTSSDLSHHNRTQSKLEMANYWCKMCKVYFCRSHKLTCDKRLHAFCCSACNELFCTHKKLKIHVKKFAHYSLDKPKYIEPLQEHELYPDKVQDGLKKMQNQKENEPVRKSPKKDLNGKRHCEQDLEVPLKRFKLSVRKLILDEDQSSTSVQDSAPEAIKEIQMELKSPNKPRKGKPYCKKCNKSFKDSVDLARHKALVHEEKQDSFVCQVCSMEFSAKDDLDKHCFLHNGEHIHTCPVCGQEFRNSMQLTKHLRIHVGDFPYKCTQCGRAFRLKIQLIQHVRLHMVHDANTSGKCSRNVSVVPEHQDPCEAGTFRCHLCSKKFLFRYKLLNHLRLHTNVKCFQCYVCHKTFATKCYLQRHLQVHVKQGMDVDVQNIIIDDDSKLELDNVKHQITRDYFQNNDDVSNRNIFDSFEGGDLKKPFLGIKRSISNFELACRAKDCYSANFDKFSKDNENQSVNISNTNIKVEVPDYIDSISEHSFCSSFTRDSERSDPFKFSSDESYTFKTAMAKERRRLRRRFRKSQCLFVKSNTQTAPTLKKADLNTRSECLEHVGDDQEVDVTDMVIEVNTVRSELDDVTTVYVNLAHRKSSSPANVHSRGAAETGSTLEDNTSLSKCKLNIKDEIVETQKNNETELIESSSSGVGNAQQGADQTTSGAKTLMFEFDVELDGGIKQFSEVDVSKMSSKHKREKQIIQEHKEQEISEIDNSKKNLLSNVPKGNKSPAKSVPPSKKKSPLKFITPDSSAASGSSNLEKLQAVFEHSSKYLPLPSTFSSNHQKSAHDHSEVRDTATEEEVKPIPEHSSLDAGSSNNSCFQEKLTSTAQELCDREKSLLPSISAQTRVIIDSKPDITASDTKIQQVINPGLDSRIGKSHTGNISEKSFKFKSTSSETLGSNKCDMNIFMQKDLKESSLDNNTNMNVFSSSITNSHTLQDINNCIVTNSLLSQTMNATNISHVIPQQSGHLGSGLISHPQFSVPNALNYYPVVGNSGTDLSHLQSGLNINPSAFMNLNPFLGPVYTRDFSGDAQAMSSGCNTHPLNTTAAFENCLISTNPLVNQSIGLNPSANQNLQFSLNQDCFHLNSSAIFDASNPMYRDMNMMDLLGTPQADYTQNVATTNLDFLRQGNSEIQLRQGATANAEAQSVIFQQHNPFLHLGNSALNANGNFGNPLNSLMNQGVISVSYGPLNNSVLQVRPGEVDGVDNSMLNTSNFYSPVYRDVGTFGNSSFQQLSTQVANFGGQVPMNVSSIFPLNTGSLNNISSLRAGGFNAPVSMNFADLGGSSMASTNLQSFNQANLHYDFPLSIPTSHHLVNNPGPSMAAFSTSGLQDGLNNFISSSGINLFNTVVPQNNGTLPGSALSFINSFNAGLFPKF